MIQVRPVCGGLSEAMDNIREYETMDDFAEYVTKELSMFRMWMCSR